MINVNFNNYSEVVVPALYQWDKGQKLQISGITAANTFQVHFCTKQCASATIRIAYQEGEYWVVAIPNALLERGININAFIYMTNEEEGQTIKRISIPVKPRVKPADFISEPDPTEQELIEELIAYCNRLGVAVDEYRTFSEVRIMTKAEYQALETKKEGVIYAFSDDDTLEQIESEIAAAESELEKTNAALDKAVARLDALGFKEGVVSLPSELSGATVDVNFIRRQGKYVYGKVELSNMSVVVNHGNILFTIPEGFRISATAQSRINEVYGYATYKTLGSGFALGLYFHTDGTAMVSTAYSSSYALTDMCVVFGYEID